MARTPGSIVLAQCNLQRAKLALGELRNYAESGNVDVAMIQEPYCWRGRDGKLTIPGFGRQADLLTACHTEHQRIGAAVVNFDRKVDVVRHSHLSSRNLVAMGLSCRGFSFVVVSVYCPPGEDLGPTLDSLESVLRHFRGQHVVISGDFNARSVMWHDTVNDRRGLLFERFISASNLCVVNRPGRPPTFSTANGSSHVDVTLCTQGLVCRVREWDVCVDAITSDHRLLRFEVLLHSGVALEDSPSRRSPDLHNINHERLVESSFVHLERHARTHDVLTGSDQIDSAIDRVTNGMKSVIDEVIRFRDHSGRRLPWWTDGLSRLKARLARLRRCAQAGSEDWETYRRALREYKRAIGRAKSRSWHKFVEADLGTNPWGCVYRLASGGLRSRFILDAVCLAGDSFTKDFLSTVEATVDQLMPDDDPGLNVGVLRDRALQACNLRGSLVRLVNVDSSDILNAVSSIRKYRAPGPDGIFGVVAQSLIPKHIQLFKLIYSSCMAQGYFPSSWKGGNLVLIPKPSGEGVRPITLLSELGKVFERIVWSKFLDEFSLEDLYSPNQFGFLAGRSTTGAIDTLLAFIRNNVFKHCCTIFIDIKGAFNNLWWPTVLIELSNKGLSDTLLRVISSYLTDRSITFGTVNASVTKVLTKGCPQGSVLGPFLWNLAVDIFLRRVLPENCMSVAYADDVAIAIKANSRRELEDKILACVGVLESWAHENKLAISLDKSVYMLFPSTLSRNPVVRINGTCIRRVSQFRYLGVVLDERLQFEAHVNYIVEKSKVILNNLQYFARQNFGLNVRRSLSVIYRSGIIPIVGYALKVWSDRLDKARIIRKLGSLHAQYLRLSLCAYRSVPVDTLSVLAKIPPLDILLAEMLAKQALKYDSSVVHLGESVREFSSLGEAHKRIEEISLNVWQTRWAASSKGRYCFRLIPNIRAWLNSDIRLTFSNVQVLSGHGNYTMHLHRIGKSLSPDCVRCGVVDDALHRITNCPVFEVERSLGNWPGSAGQVLERLALDAGCFDVVVAHGELDALG